MKNVVNKKIDYGNLITKYIIINNLLINLNSFIFV